MDSSNLSPAQAEKTREALGPTFGYLARLVQRMELGGFPT